MRRGVIVSAVLALLMAAPASARWSAPVALTPDAEVRSAWDAGTDRAGGITVARQAEPGILSVRTFEPDGSLRTEDRFALAADLYRVDLEVAPSGAALLAWKTSLGGGAADVSATARPAGGRFTEPRQLSNSSDLGSLDAEQAPVGTGVITWIEPAVPGTTSSTRSVMVARSSPAGIAEPVGVVDNWRSAITPRAAMDESGRALIAWRGDNGGRTAAWAARAAAEGNFGAPQRVSAPDVRVYASSLARGENGSLTLAFDAVTPGRPGDLAAAATGTVADGFQQAQTLDRAPTPGQPRVAASPGRGAVAWRVSRDRVVVATTGAGARFRKPRVVSGVQAAGARVVIDAVGTTVVAYHEGRRLREPQAWAVQISSGGRVRARERLVTGRRYLESRVADLTVDATGRCISLVQRLDIRRGFLEAAVRPPGARFRAPQVVVRSGINVLDEHPRLASAEGGRVFAMWQHDDREDTPFLSRIEASELR